MCFGPLPEEWKNVNIVILEIFSIVLSVLLWGHLMQNQRIIFYSGNAALVGIINKTTSRDPTVRIFFHQLVLACLTFNILFRFRHVPGVKSNLANALSRLQVLKVQELAPAGVQIYDPSSRPSSSTQLGDNFHSAATIELGNYTNGFPTRGGILRRFHPPWAIAITWLVPGPYEVLLGFGVAERV